MFHNPFKRRPASRHYAQLDQQGRCLSLWQLQQMPETGRWVEVSESNPLWIGQALPAAALVRSSPPASRSAWGHMWGVEL